MLMFAIGFQELLNFNSFVGFCNCSDNPSRYNCFFDENEVNVRAEI
jgi:hypothetical protein